MGLLNIVLLAALCVSAFAEIAKIEHCQDAPAEDCQVSEVRITPCNLKKKHGCEFRKGTNVSISFDFTPNFNADSLTTTVFWATGVWDFPFRDLDSVAACPAYTTCPAQAGQSQTFQYTIHSINLLSSDIPTGPYRLKWKVWNADKSKVCCFMTNIKILQQNKAD